MSDERDFKEPQEERKFIVEILEGEYDDDGFTMFYYRINSVDDTWEGGYYTVQSAKEYSILILNRYAKIFGLPKVKESQITYIEPDEIN